MYPLFSAQRLLQVFAGVVYDVFVLFCLVYFQAMV